MNEEIAGSPITGLNDENELGENETYELCQTCGKWIESDNYCYGCKKPVGECCC